MAIKEIWVPEALIVFFMALPLLRPFIKGLWALDGLVWLPLIALGITVGIFPAYGFRLECVPMLLFVIVYNIGRLSLLVSKRSGDFVREQGPLQTGFFLVLLGIVAIPMFVFSPQIHAAPETMAEPVAVFTFSNTAASPATGLAGSEYHVRVYGPIQSNRPLIFIVPPEMGAAASIDLICMDLQKRGYTVVTYSRKGYDVALIDENGRRRIVSLTKLFTYQRVLRKATERFSANEQGKTLEAQRRADIEFLLPRIAALPGNIQNSGPPPLILAGYGAGGSALAYLAGEHGFTSRYNNVAGVIAIESRLWSSYLPEARRPVILAANTGIIQRYWTSAVEWVQLRQPQRVIRTGPLPDTGLPVLYLVSSRALDFRAGQKSYQAIFDAMRTSPGPIAITAIEDAGLLGYQDFPITHPIYSFLFPGLKNSRKSEDPVSATVSIIGNYASFLLNQAASEKVTVPPTQAITGSLYLESKGLSQFRL